MRNIPVLVMQSTPVMVGTAEVLVSVAGTAPEVVSVVDMAPEVVLVADVAPEVVWVAGAGGGGGDSRDAGGVVDASAGAVSGCGVRGHPVS